MKTKSLIYLALSLLFAALLIAYSSCKKEEDEKPATTQTVISDETVIAEDKGLENPTVSGNTYTYDYSGSEPDISVGEVIVGQTGDGYMRIVTGVTYQNNQLILETEQAKLTDVIDNCDISDSITLNLGQKSATINGSPIHVELIGLKEGMTIQEDLVNLSNVVLYSGQVNGVTLEAKITEGYIAFEPVIHRKLKIRPVNGKPTITEFLLTAKGQIDFVCNVEATCDGNLSYTPEMDPLLTFWIGPMFFGPIPAFIKFSFTPGFESAFIINGYLTKGYQANATVEFGAQYLYDEGWNKITEKQFVFNEDPLQWSLNGNLHAKTWVTPQIDLKLAGVLGPYMNVNPFLGFDGQVNLPQWSWALSGGVDGYLGFDMSLFGWQIVNFNTTIFDWEVVIAEQSGMQAGLPVVATKAVSEITASSAKCGGNISSDGGAAITARGVCWSTSQNPTVSDNHTTDGSGTGQFTSSITGLNASTTYFARAYASNSEGTAYGAQVQFTSSSAGEIMLINENFERYNIGIFPTSGGWEILYHGTGNNDQFVSDYVSNSGEKSIKISGTSGWRAEIVQPISVLDDDILSYQASFYSVPGDPGGRCCFFNPEIGTWGTSIQAIAFYDNKVIFDQNEIYTFPDNQWVNVRLEYNQNTDIINLWVNDEHLLTNYPVNDNTIPITHFSISTRYGSGSCKNYWDDIIVSKHQ